MGTNPKIPNGIRCSICGRVAATDEDIGDWIIEWGRSGKKRRYCEECYWQENESEENYDEEACY